MTTAARLTVVLFAGIAVVGVVIGMAGLVVGRTLRATNEQLRADVAAEREARAAADAANVQLRDDNAGKTEQVRVMTQALATGPELATLVDEIRAMATAVVSAVERTPRAR